MFALRARPPALPARRSAPRRPAAPATKTPRSPKSAPLTAQALRCSIPCDGPRKREEYRAPASSARCAFFVHHSTTQGRNLAPLFSYLYELLLPQLPYFDIHAKHTGVYPAFASYCYPNARARDLHSLFTASCELFQKTTRDGWVLLVSKTRVQGAGAIPRQPPCV